MPPNTDDGIATNAAENLAKMPAMIKKKQQASGNTSAYGVVP
jgi:hypothetical protein